MSRGRSGSGAEVSVIHKLGLVIYLCTTDLQTVNYNSTDYALEPIYVSIGTNSKRRKHNKIFSFFQLSAIALTKSRNTFDCFANVNMYLLRLSSAKTALHRLTP